MTASTARHETRALLRAHLAAASGYRHLTRHCPICHRLLRLAMEPAADSMEPVTGFLGYVTASGPTRPLNPPTCRAGRQWPSRTPPRPPRPLTPPTRRPTR
ncbi:DUF6274 family protein [Streptomyces sp. NPDC051664]|uniref:DUF6274 family protein n=1 Tax=Streptomyces sp. NPDC051664 TaxID=3365668 RepID=UPI00379EB4EF